jgi:ATP-dependent Lhr-like helicase
MALYLRHQVPLLHRPVLDLAPEGALHDVLRSHLGLRGASFFQDLYLAAEGGPQDAVLEALWDLVWAGEVTNDTLAPLRAFVAAKSRRKARTPAFPSAVPPLGSGRWYLVGDLLAADEPIASEMKAAAIAEQLLERHGVVTRDAVLAEGVPGGFSGLYPVFTAMEDAGRVRRGYFIEGRGGSQFALPGAVDRLRATKNTGVVILAATDPANAYGASLPWPENVAGRPARRAGSHVVLSDGQLVAYAERGGRTVLTFVEDRDLVAANLVQLAVHRRQRVSVGTIDGEPAAGGRWNAALQREGFVPGYRGLTFTPRNSRGRA